MKILGLSMVIWVLAIGPGVAVASSAKLAAAHAAYDRGEFAIARTAYTELIQQGHGSAGLWYNAGNAAFREGDIGRAILNYRRAWQLAPRDPDIAANMNLAAQRTGAALPQPRLLDRAAQELSHREWTRLFSTAYWIAIAAAALWILLPGSRKIARPVTAIASLIALTALSGWGYWKIGQQEPEAVVMAARQTALYEPREKATPFFNVPEGSLVTIEEHFDAWVKVRSGEKSGWLPRTSVAQVYPWQAY